MDVEFKRPRVVARQAYRSNQPSENVEEFFRISILIPHLESVISSLRNRFFSTHKKAFSLMKLHPENMRKLDTSSFLAMEEDRYREPLRRFSTHFYCRGFHVIRDVNTDEASDSALNESLGDYADLIAKAIPFHPAI